MSRLPWLALAAAHSELPASAQEEVGFDLVYPHTLPVWEDVAVWIGLALAAAAFWTLARAAADAAWFPGFCRSVRYYWPTFMLGWCWLTIVPTWQPSGQPWASVLDLLEFSFFVINMPVLIVVVSLGVALGELGGFDPPPIWLLGLAFWATWFVVLGYLAKRDSSKKPLSLGIVQRP